MWGGLVALVAMSPEPGEDLALRLLSYNIRHGAGMDGKVDIGRSGALMNRLRPDLVGLQEVDNSVNRSGSVDQARELGRITRMYSTFGSFMAYQGGHYGMGALSKFPVTRRESIRLPEGNEPRIALLIEVKLPTGEKIALINVHFDWVSDDGYRFEQAKFLAARLGALKMPYVLLGDFNDEPESRTIDLFRQLAAEVKKPPSDPFTFSSTDPVKEIDFVFVSPARRWSVRSMKVIDEPLVSDHRPVLAEVVLRGLWD